MTHEPPLPTFKQIGKYKIEGLISRGGMSLLYLASDPENQQALIIKVLLPKYALEKDIVDRFLNEKHIISLTNHPNIVRLIDSGPWEGGLFIAMEFVKGTSLRKIFQHQPYTLKRAMDVLLQVSYALSHLHAHGIVHGDLKPENILIDEHGQVKLIDFGIATLLTEEKRETPSRFIGTPIYMSPELGLDRRNLSFQSDIFALGIIAYELAIGKISHGRIITSLAPRGLQKLLQKSLQPRPIDRYSDMCDFVADLSAYIKSGDLEKDKQGSDQFLEVFEKLENIQNALIPQEAPLWHSVDVGIAHTQGMGLSGLYIDLFDISDEIHLIFAAECSKKGPEGLIGACMLKGMVRSLLDTMKEKGVLELSKVLLEHIGKDIFTGSISFAFLSIDSTGKEYGYYHNGFGVLAHISQMPGPASIIIAEKIPGSDVLYAHGTFNQDDCLLFIGTTQKLSQQYLIEEIAKDANATSTQSASETILRKIRLKSESSYSEPPLSVILLHIVNSYGKKLPPLK